MTQRAREEGDVPHSRGFLLGLVLLLLLIALLLARAYLGAIVLALLFSYLLHKPFEALAKRVRWRSVAAGIMLLLFALALFGPLAIIVSALRSEAAVVVEIARDPQRIEAAAATALAPFGVDPEQSAAFVERATAQAAAAIQGAAAAMAPRVAHVLAGFLIFFFLLFFGLRDGAAAMAAIRTLIPLREEAKGRLLAMIGARTRAIAVGTFLVGLVQGVAGGLGWWFFGFPAPVFWGFVIAVFAVLPFGPPFLIMAPAGVIALLNGDLFAGIGMIVYAAVVVGLVDDVLRPWLVGKRSGVHPALVLVGTLGGLAVFGVSGFLLGPLALGMLGPVLEVWADERRAAA